MNRNRRYNVNDVRAIAKNYGQMTVSDLAAALGLNIHVVYKIIRILREYIDLPYTKISEREEL